LKEKQGTPPFSAYQPLRMSACLWQKGREANVRPKKENVENWLSADAANNMFKDKPDQCANQ